MSEANNFITMSGKGSSTTLKYASLKTGSDKSESNVPRNTLMRMTHENRTTMEESP